MKILLVYPEYPRTYWSFHYALKFISKKACFPPLGLITIAALLPPAWEKKLVDLNVEALDEKDIKWADYIFISAMVVQRESVRRIIEACKKQGKPIVAGGPLFTTEPEAYNDVDHLVLNEGEITIPRFLRDIELGTPRHTYTSEEWADLTKTPAPLWELIDLRKYASINLQYSRGCPFTCDFCNITSLYGRIPRTKDCRQVLNELDGIYSKGWTGGVFFVDDNFISNKKKLKAEILPAIGKWMDEHGHPFEFFTEASVDLSDDPELMEKMVRAGFVTVFVGIETPEEGSLSECNKNQNRNRNLMDSVRIMQKAGLQVQGGFIVGFDNDSQSTFDNLAAFIQESGIVTAMVGLLNAPKGTKLYQRLLKEGRLVSSFSGDNTNLSMNFIPKMNYDILINGYRSILEKIYSPRHYYERVIKFLKEYQPIQTSVFHFHTSDIGAFFKSAFLLGIVGKERFYYWKLFFWSLFRKPELFPMAITFSIYGFHFRKISESCS